VNIKPAPWRHAPRQVRRRRLELAKTGGTNLWCRRTATAGTLECPSPHGRHKRTGPVSLTGGLPYSNMGVPHEQRRGARLFLCRLIKVGGMKKTAAQSAPPLPLPGAAMSTQRVPVLAQTRPRDRDHPRHPSKRVGRLALCARWVGFCVPAK
jgi:hypothetical protein